MVFGKTDAEKFAYDIRFHILYGKIDRVTFEFPDGGVLEASVGEEVYCGEDWINLVIRYTKSTGEERSMVLEWFPSDEELARTIETLRQDRMTA